jgi:CheY-like chemotaxis protein
MDQVEFQNQCKDILNHLSDPAYLENHALMDLFTSRSEAPLTTRIQALRDFIQTSINSLKPPEGTPTNAAEWRCYRILTSRFFQLKEWHVIEDELGLSQRQVQRDLKKGLDALTLILWDQYTTREKELTASKPAPEEESETYDQDLIKEELKDWEVSYDLTNISLIVEQALQLCTPHLSKTIHEHMSIDVDAGLHVMVDQVLIKQGLYKVFSMIKDDTEKLDVAIKTRKVNDYFYELSITFNKVNEGAMEAWNIAQLFFTIQGMRHAIQEENGITTISIFMPVRKQTSCLVIDDVEAIRRLIERILGAIGVQVFGTDNYPYAMNLIQLVKPDFILLDILMPKMDGWQMIKNLKSSPGTKGIPVIICSVLYEPELSKAVNAAAYIRKPINRLELIQTLQELNLIQGES